VSIQNKETFSVGLKIIDISDIKKHPLSEVLLL
jgi:hypothetical protein